MSTINTTDPDPTALHYALSLRTERPIEGCELAPHPYLFMKGGQIDNATRAKMMDANPHYFVVSWSRGPRRQICQNQSCPRGNTYEPVNWTKTALGGPGLRCAVCEKLGVASHQSMFCSTSCFKAAWKGHSTAKHSQLSSIGHQTNEKLDDKENIHKRTRSLLAMDVADESSQGAASPTNLIVHENGEVGRAAIDDVEPSARMASPAPDASWTPLSTDKAYVPTKDDVGCVLKIEVTALTVSDNSVLAGPLVSFTEPVLAAPRGPPKRQLVTAPAPASSGSTGTRFRIISYNILAEQYATKQAYPYCDSWSLSWPFRRGIIQQELEEAQGDIVCLQEVQSDHYEQHLSPFMQGLGYDGLFKQKSRETMGNYGKVDGCATFWRKSKFILSENYSIEFNECARQAASALGLDEGECRRYMNRLSRDNVAQIVVLEAISRSTSGANVRQPRQMTNICVVNTHLYSNHLRPDVKLWQTMTLMREIENFVIPRDIAVIVCGDFNSEPDSAVYEFLSEGALDQPRPELEQSDTVGILPDQSEIHHRVDLASVMGTVLGSEPEFTNFTSTFKGTLDYVWYTPGRLRVLAASNVPDANDLTATCGEGLPSASYPSDHIMLCADMTLTVTGAGTITRQQTAPQVPHRRGMPVGGLASGGLGGAGTMKKPGQYGGNAMRSALGGR